MNTPCTDCIAYAECCGQLDEGGNCCGSVVPAYRCRDVVRCSREDDYDDGKAWSDKGDDGAWLD